MLRYTLEFEQKIADCKLQSDKTFFLSNAMWRETYWHEERQTPKTSYPFISRVPIIPMIRLQNARSSTSGRRKSSLLKLSPGSLACAKPQGDVL